MAVPEGFDSKLGDVGIVARTGAGPGHPPAVPSHGCSAFGFMVLTVLSKVCLKATLKKMKTMCWNKNPLLYMWVSGIGEHYSWEPKSSTVCTLMTEMKCFWSTGGFLYINFNPISSSLYKYLPAIVPNATLVLQLFPSFFTLSIYCKTAGKLFFRRKVLRPGKKAQPWLKGSPWQTFAVFIVSILTGKIFVQSKFALSPLNHVLFVL